MWANEAESAVLSGYPADGVRFRQDLPNLEGEGFPRTNPRNGKRFIPAIERFFWGQLDGQFPTMPQSGLGNARDYEDD